MLSPRNQINSDCQYVVIPTKNSCGLFLSLLWFELTESQNCEKENLNIEGIKLCGKKTGETGEDLLIVDTST